MKAIACLQWLTGGGVIFNTQKQVIVTHPTQAQYVYGDEITVTWLPFPGAKEYVVEIGVESQTVTGLSATFSGLTTGDKEVNVTARRDLVVNTVNVVDFTITNIEPVVIAIPTEGYNYTYDILPDYVNISVDFQAYYEEYYFQVYTNLNVLVSEGIGGAGGTLENYDCTISSYGSYKCRVRAKVTGGNYGDYSEYVSFNVIPPEE